MHLIIGFCTIFSVPTFAGSVYTLMEDGTLVEGRLIQSSDDDESHAGPDTQQSAGVQAHPTLERIPEVAAGTIQIIRGGFVSNADAETGYEAHPPQYQGVARPDDAGRAKTKRYVVRQSYEDERAAMAAAYAKRSAELAEERAAWRKKAQMRALLNAQLRALLKARMIGSMHAPSKNAHPTDNERRPIRIERPRGGN